MRNLLVGVAIAISAPAAAESLVVRAPSIEPPPSSLQIGKPDLGARVETVTVALWVKETEVIATLGLDLEGADRTARDITLPLVLPAGSRATAMEVSIAGTRTTAFAMAAQEARMFYKDTVARMIDPALLERHGDALALHVFPIVAGGNQHVEITLTMPRLATFTIEPAGYTLRTLALSAEGRTTTSLRRTGVTRATTLRLPEAHRELAAEPVTRAAVDLATSLVAGRSSISTGPELSITIGGPSRYRGPRTVDKSIIRSRIKLARPRLTHCYELELLRDHALAGRLDVQFLVHRSGQVTVRDVTGTLDDDVVRSCVAGVFASLEYPESDGDTLVNYPLTFRAE